MRPDRAQERPDDSTTKGKAYFIAWSMDVKVESENVVRHLDMTTHNHGSKNATGLDPRCTPPTGDGRELDDAAEDARRVRDEVQKRRKKDDGARGC